MISTSCEDRFQFPDKLDAVDIREIQVRQDEVERLIVRRGQTVDSGRCRHDSVALVRQVESSKLEHRGVIVDNQDIRLLHEYILQLNCGDAIFSGQLAVRAGASAYQ